MTIVKAKIVGNIGHGMTLVELTPELANAMRERSIAYHRDWLKRHDGKCPRKNCKSCAAIKEVSP